MADKELGSGNIDPAGFPKSAPGSSVGLPSASNSHLPGRRLPSAFHRRTHPLATEEVLMSMSTIVVAINA